MVPVQKERPPFRVSAWTRALPILAAIALIAYGIWRGELGTVLAKSINICLECIGLG